MRKLLVTAAVAGSLAAFVAPAPADVSHTQNLPVAACNQGTMNAHESIPETTGTGATTPGHEAVPGHENSAPDCGHGG
jgi:hypothetical protein